MIKFAESYKSMLNNNLINKILHAQNSHFLSISFQKKMRQACIIELMILVIISGISCTTSAASQEVQRQQKQSPLGNFESNIKIAMTDFGNRLVATMKTNAPIEFAPRSDELMNMITSYLTELAVNFIAAIEAIVIDILMSLWENPRPAEQVLKEMVDRFTIEYTKLLKSIYDLVMYLESIFGGYLECLSETNDCIYYTLNYNSKRVYFSLKSNLIIIHKRRED